MNQRLSFSESENPLTDMLSVVEWKSNFMLMVISFDVFWVMLAIYSAISMKKIRILVSIITAILSFATESLNALLSSSFLNLGLQVNVFDADGMFMSVFWAAPLIFSLIILVISYIHELFAALVSDIRIRAKIKALSISRSAGGR